MVKNDFMKTCSSQWGMRELNAKLPLLLLLLLEGIEAQGERLLVAARGVGALKHSQRHRERYT